MCLSRTLSPMVGPNLRLRGAWFSVLLLILGFNSQIFAATASNALGVKGFQEFFLFALLIYSSGVVATTLLRTGGHIHRLDIAVYALVIGMWSYSSIAAYFRFGQPIYYGLIEERRVLAFLIYFPIAQLLRKHSLGLQDVMIAITWIAWIAMLLSAGVKWQIVPSLQEMEFGAGALRQDRYGIGHHYLAIATLWIIFLSYRSPPSATNVLSVVLFLATLILITQTRQVLIAMAIAAAVMIARPSFRSVVVGVIALAVASAAYFWTVQLNPEIGEKYAELFAQAVSREYLDTSVRALGYDIVVGELASGFWAGSGSLSQLWRDGFARVYGDFFFLTDLGFGGSLYKFGLIAVVWYLTYFYLQLSWLGRSRHAFEHRFLIGWFVYLIVALPVAAPVEYRGFLAGLLLAVSAFGTKPNTMHSTSTVYR